jgi:hypothetical protein
MLLADIKEYDQAVLNLENMACLRIEQRVPVQIARGQMNLEVGCSIQSAGTRGIERSASRSAASLNALSASSQSGE